MKFSAKRSHTSRRQASILVCTLICLAVATTLVLSTVRSALQARRQIRAERQLVQVQFVLEAGIQRATARLKSADLPQDEIWTLAPKTLPGDDTAQVVIKTTDETVHIVARLPATGPVAVQRSYSFPVSNSTSPIQE